MAMKEFTKEDYAATYTFLRDVLSDYRGNKVIGYDVLCVLLNDSRLKLPPSPLRERAIEHMVRFYAEGIVKGFKP